MNQVGTSFERDELFYHGCFTPSITTFRNGGYSGGPCRTFLLSVSPICPSLSAESAAAMHYLEFFGLLDWNVFPKRDLETDWGMLTLPYMVLVAAYLVKLELDIDL
ncbi:MAG: hypothetical protein JXA21_12955 [Anaerolineae bacterium]|nr:hypothetical protein [Anaerolineae bacterium]